jgi:transposase
MTWLKSRISFFVEQCVWVRAMARRFKTPDYEATLDETVTIGDCLPPEHLARFVVKTVSSLDLGAIYSRYGAVGGESIAPEILLGLLFYGYATGIFSSRKIEKATYEVIPFRFIAGGLHPDHDTIANFRRRFLAQIKGLFVQILVLAAREGKFQIGNISLDGTKVHADASKSHAVSYKRLIELEERLEKEVEELFALSEMHNDLPQGLDVEEELQLREKHLTDLRRARQILEERARERYEAELAEYEAKVRDRQERAEREGHKPTGRDPKPPIPGPHNKDQYNFTDPESRIMKNSNNSGFDQHYNVQVAVDQNSFLIVSNTVSNHPNDYEEAIPTLNAIPKEVGKPNAVALDNGYFSTDNISGIESLGVEPYIATGREPHHKSWKDYFSVEQLVVPPEDASRMVKMAFKLKAEIGNAIYRVRKCTVEPVIGIIKEILGFRQFSLRGLEGISGEWALVCIAFDIKRLHKLLLPG